MSKLLLRANKISFGYEYTLYKDLDLKLASGQSIAVMGKSGCGKSTLVHNLSGFLPPQSGSVEMEGYDLYSIGKDSLNRLHRHYVGIVFQSHYLFKGLSAKQNIEIASKMVCKEIEQSILEMLQIQELMDMRVANLSGGQQQRVSIARVLTKKPRIIFADEPTGNLDKDTAQLVMRALLEYIKKDGAAMLLVTHDIDVARACDSIYRLEDQRLIHEV